MKEGQNMNRDQKLKEGFPYGQYILRGFLTFVPFILIKGILTVYTMIISEPDSSSSMFKIPAWAIFIFIALSCPLIYNSTVNFFTLYDRRAMKAFLEKKKPKIIFREEMGEVLRSKEYLVSTATILFFSLIAAAFGGFDEFSNMLAETGLPASLRAAMPFLAVLLIIPTVSAHAHYEVRRRWHYLDHTDRIDTLYSIVRILAKAAIIFFGYILILPISPVVIVAYLSIFGIFGVFFDAYFVLIALSVIAAVVAIALLISMCRALRARKKLLKKLRKFSAASEYELSEINRPYASLFKPLRECSFTLKKDGKVFSCRLIGAWWHKAPLYFISDRHAYYRHRLGTNAHHIDMLGEFCYDFEGEGQKILILNPVPKKAFVTKGGEYVEHSWYDDDKMGALRSSGKMRYGKPKSDSVKRLEPGDKIWGYTIYNTTSFIGAIDRKCLGRTNGMYE